MSTTKCISFTYQEFEKSEDLLPEDQELVLAAKDAATNAYAPYSRFCVGAAVRLSSGRIIKGSNVENAAFPSGICAERSVLSHAVTNFPDDFTVTMAIAALDQKGNPAKSVSPCGNCRQVIAEEESRTGKKIRLILAGTGNTLVIDSCSDLLPLQFSGKSITAGLP
jgi:cytidine deaminase